MIFKYLYRKGKSKNACNSKVTSRCYYFINLNKNLFGEEK